MSVVDVVECAFPLCLTFNALIFVPQSIKIFRTKNVQGLSAVTFVGFNIVQLVSALHGYFRNDSVLMWGNVAAFFLCGIVTVFIFKYRK